MDPEQEWTSWALRVGRSVRNYRRFYALTFLVCMVVPIGAAALPVWPYTATLQHPYEPAWTQQHLVNLNKGLYGYWFNCPSSSSNCFYNVTRTYHAGLFPYLPDSPSNIRAPEFSCFFLLKVVGPAGYTLVLIKEPTLNSFVLVSNSSGLEASIC